MGKPTTTVLSRIAIAAVFCLLFFSLGCSRQESYDEEEIEVEEAEEQENKNQSRENLKDALKILRVEKPDLANPKAVNRPRFTFKYPGNWKMDKQADDYDPDHNFSIDTPGEGGIVFLIFDTDIIEPEAMVTEMVHNMKIKMVKDAKESKFSHWGKNKGYGIELKGRILIMKGRCRIFTFEQQGLLLLVMETRYSEDEKVETPGYDLISGSFKLKPPKKAKD